MTRYLAGLALLLLACGSPDREPEPGTVGGNRGDPVRIGVGGDVVVTGTLECEP